MNSLSIQGKTLLQVIYYIVTNYPQSINKYYLLQFSWVKSSGVAQGVGSVSGSLVRLQSRCYRAWPSSESLSKLEGSSSKLAHSHGCSQEASVFQSHGPLHRVACWSVLTSQQLASPREKPRRRPQFFSSPTLSHAHCFHHILFIRSKLLGNPRSR